MEAINEENIGIVFAVFFVIGLFSLFIYICYRAGRKTQKAYREYFERKGFTYKDCLDNCIDFYEAFKENLASSCDNPYISPEEVFRNPDIADMIQLVDSFGIVNFQSINHYTFGHFKYLNDIQIGLINYQNDMTPGNRYSASTYSPLFFCVIYRKDAKFPEFSMRSRRFLIDWLFSKGDFQIDEDKEFTSKFILEGRDIEDIKNFFNSNNRKAFVKYHQKGYYYKAKNNCFIVIQNNYNNDLEEKKREVLLERALSIYNELTFPAKQEE